MLLSCLVLIHLSALIGSGNARAAIIDDWRTAQQLATPPQTVEGVVSGPGIIGGFRASSLLAAGADASSLSIGNGTLAFTVDPAASGNVFLSVTWDGMPPGVGLGGVDVTDDGRADGFVLEVLHAEGDIQFALVVEDTTLEVGNVLGIIPDGARNLRLFLPFSEFIGQGQPVRIDMTRVNEVRLQLGVPPGGEILLGPIQTPHATAAVPEPASVCLWALLGVAGIACLRRRRRGFRPL
jgi:hypothetical protein